MSKMWLVPLVMGLAGRAVPCTAQISADQISAEQISTKQIDAKPISADWPAPNTDVTTYHTVFECLAATDRVTAKSSENLVVRDTLALVPDDVLNPLPSEVKDIAQRCSAKFRADAVPLSEYNKWITLYLQADRDADAQTVVRRRLAAVGTGQVKRTRPESDAAEIQAVAPSLRERAEVLQTVASLYLGAAPSRLAEALPYVQEMQTLGNASPWQGRLNVAFALFNVARVAGDTVLARQGAQWVIDIPKQFTEEQRQAPPYQSVTGFIMMAQRYLTRDAGADSLRKSTAAYLALQRSLRQEISRTDDRIGAKAETLAGDFRFPATGGKTFPAPGRITLILAEGGLEWGSNEIGAMFRRWKSRFPNLDIVYAAHTRGFFGGMTPPPPDTEAQYRRRKVQDFYAYPASVVVEKTSFWHLPDPDRRRINKPTSNQTHYGDRLWLIDQAGTIIHYATPGKGSEKEFTDLIDALASRP